MNIEQHTVDTHRWDNAKQVGKDFGIAVIVVGILFATGSMHL